MPRDPRSALAIQAHPSAATCCVVGTAQPPPRPDARRPGKAEKMGLRRTSLVTCPSPLALCATLCVAQPGVGKPDFLSKATSTLALANEVCHGPPSALLGSTPYLVGHMRGAYKMDMPSLQTWRTDLQERVQQNRAWGGCSTSASRTLNVRSV